MSELHHILRIARIEAGWTGRQMGYWLGHALHGRPVSHAAISDIERGKRRITVELLRAWGGLCGLSVTELMDAERSWTLRYQSRPTGRAS